MNSAEVRVVLIAATDSELAFDLIFADNCIKHCQLDRYQIQHYRSAGIRQIIEQVAQDYLDSINEKVDEIHLTFL